MQNKKALVTKQLGVMEELLPAHDFLRTHRSYIVNLSHVKKYFKNDGGYLMMSNGDKVDVSRRKKEEFMCLF
jgi:two-component system LytT family response regulator